MTQSQAWAVWAAAILACPIVVFAMFVGFRVGWLVPGPSGWADHAVGLLLIAHALLCLAAIITPPQSARGGSYLVAFVVVVFDFCSCFILAGATVMAAAGP